MAMQYDGKTYRNLQEQVAYLTAKWQQLADEIDAVRAQIPSKMIVEELPEEGDPLITYYVGPKGTAPDLYYEVWVWVQEEPDGPFVWRELEDTDQVDLSGYLPIQDGVTTLPQVYGKTEAGEQAMMNMDIAATALTIPFRDANGRTKVAAPDADGDAANKKYCDDGFVPKDTSVTTYNKVYIKSADGTQGLVDLTIEAGLFTIPLRDGNGRLRCKDPAGAGEEVVNIGYLEERYLPKQKVASANPQLYGKATDGAQTMFNANANPTSDSIPIRFAYGHLKLPNMTTYPPTDDDFAVSKRYVNAVIGQLLYLHDIILAYDIDGTNSLFIRCFIINGSATALTSLSRDDFARLTIGAGGIGTSTTNLQTACAITKLPGHFVYGRLGDPNDGFMYQHFSGGSLVSASVAKGTNTLTVTDSVIAW